MTNEELDLNHAIECVEQLDVQDGVRWWRLERQPSGEYHVLLRMYEGNGEITHRAEDDSPSVALHKAIKEAKGD